MNIRRNKDGQQNLLDLRAALAACRTATVQRLGGTWEVSKKSIKKSGVWGDVWFTYTLPYHYTERQAIQSALFGEVETPEEAQYNARKAAE